MEILLDETNLPQVIWSLEILEIVPAIDVDEVELAVFGRITPPSEPLVQYQIVFFRIASQFAPDDKCSATVGYYTGHSAEPVGATLFLLEASLQTEALLSIVFECGGVKSLGCGDVVNRKTDQPVEGL